MRFTIAVAALFAGVAMAEYPTAGPASPYPYPTKGEEQHPAPSSSPYPVYPSKSEEHPEPSKSVYPSKSEEHPVPTKSAYPSKSEEHPKPSKSMSDEHPAPSGYPSKSEAPAPYPTKVITVTECVPTTVTSTVTVSPPKSSYPAGPSGGGPVGPVGPSKPSQGYPSPSGYPVKPTYTQKPSPYPTSYEGAASNVAGSMVAVGLAAVAALVLA